MNVSDEEDEVVEEMDVYLSKDLSQNFYLLQFPTNSNAKHEFSADQRLAARVKPQHKKMEIDVLLDVSSPNYEQSKGEQIAVNVDGGPAGDGITYENSVMDYQTLTSQYVAQTGKRFAVAVVQDGQVHVTPIAHILQMQPGFKYMDFADKRALHAAKMKAQAESGHSSQDEAEEAKAVTIRFKNVETEASKALREKSYAAYEKRLFQEKWINTKVHHKDDSYTDKERSRLFSNHAFSDLDDAENFPEMSVSTKDYLKSLVPRYVVSNVDSETNPENVLSLSKIKHLPLAEQLKLVIKNAKIMHFSHLASLLPSNPDDSSVVRSLQSFATLINGCWIVKSDVLYPSGSVSAVSGTLADLMCSARDFILYSFTKQEFLIRRELTKRVNIPGDEVKEMLEQVAKMKVGCGWHLKLPRDQEFINKFSEVQERQATLWANKGKLLLKRFPPNPDSS